MRSTAASAPELLAAFDELIRRRPVPDAPGDAVETVDGVVRVVSASGWSGITYADLAGRDADEVIAAQVERFPGPFEWKHYSYDEPPDLPERLVAAGFEREEGETLMFGDLAALDLASAPPPGIELREIGADDVGDLVAVHDAVFGGDHAGVGAMVRAGVARWSVVAVVAYDGATPSPRPGWSSTRELPSRACGAILRCPRTAAAASSAPSSPCARNVSASAGTATCRPTRWTPAGRCSREWAS